MRKVKQLAIFLIVFSVVFSMFGGTALGASTRFALVTDVVGTVKVTKAGGSKEIRVFNGMGLNEGDKVKVEKDSSLTLRIADREDEVVLGANWSGALSKLKDNADGGTDTAVKTWAGSMYNNVQKIAGTSNTYKVETPTAVMGVRGTHFLMTIDPLTGLPTLFVSAGKVQASADGGEGGSAVVLPGQQTTLYSETDPSAGVDYVDPESIVVMLDPSVIGALLKNKQQIDEENEEILAGLSEGADENSTLSLKDQEALERYRSNVQNTLSHVLKQAAESGKLSGEQLQEVIDTVNQAIQDPNQRFDLNRELPPIDRTAGVDPAAEEQRRQQREQAEQRRQQQQQQREERQQQVTSNNQSLINQIQQAQQQQQQANQQAQQQQANQAAERHMNQLTDEQRQALQQRQQQRQQEREQQQQQQQTRATQSPSPSPSATPTTSPSPSPTTSPSPSPTTSPSPSPSTSPSPSPTTSPSPTPAGVSTTTAVGLSKPQITHGEPVTISAKVTVSIGGAAVPNNGSVTFESQSGGVVQTLGFRGTSDGTGTATLALSAQESKQFFAAGTHQIRVRYAGVQGSYLGSTSDWVTLTVNPAAQTGDSPQVALRMIPFSVDESHLVVELSKFTDTNKIYGLQLNFLHDTQIEAKSGLSQYYNSSVFTLPLNTVDSVTQHEGMVGQELKFETIYALMLFNTTSEGVAIGDATAVATIPFIGDISKPIKLVYWQFVDRDGNPIGEVQVNGQGIIIDPGLPS